MSPRCISGSCGWLGYAYVEVGLFLAFLSASLVAYSFARFKFPGRDLMFTITLATMMLPGFVTLIPSYQIFYWLGWINTYLPLLVPTFLMGGTLPAMSRALASSLSRLGRELPKRDLRRLFEKTEGWPAALELAALALDGAAARPP